MYLGFFVDTVSDSRRHCMRQQSSTWKYSVPEFRTFRPTVAPCGVAPRQFPAPPSSLGRCDFSPVPNSFSACFCLLRSPHRLPMHGEGIRGVRHSSCCRCASIISYLLVVPTEYLLCAPMRLARLFHSPSACPPRGPSPPRPPFPRPRPRFGCSCFNIRRHCQLIIA